MAVVAVRSSRSLDGIVTARLHLTRDRGFADVFRRYTVLVNGAVAGSIKNGGTFECEIPTGKSSIQLRVDWCGSAPCEIDAGEGQLVRLECGSNLRGWKIFQGARIMRESPNQWIWLRTRGNVI